MPSQVTLRANGLNFSPNNLSLPQGSLLVADNVIIRRDNVVESRRGFNQYSEGLGISSDRAKQLMQYKNTLLVNYAAKLAFDTLELNVDGESIFDDFAGSYSEASPGLRMKSIEANRNFYFTTSEGIKRISARTSADFTTAAGFIKPAGAIQALDFTATLEIEQGETSGFLPADSAVAYRVVWGYKDLNDNLVLGVPSDRVVVFNYITNSMAMDINELTLILDTINQSTCMITDGDYATSFYTPVNSTGNLLLNNVLQLADKLDLDIVYADQGGTAPLDMDTIEITNNQCTITFDVAAVPEDYFTQQDTIDLEGFGTTFDVVNGIQTITSVDNTARTITFTVTSPDIGSATVDASATITSYNYRHITSTGDDTFATPLDQLVLSLPPTSEQLRTINNTLFRISERLKEELPGVIPTPLQTAYVTPFTLTVSANVLLDITIPSNIDSDYFVQVYRTKNFTANAEQTLGATGGIPVIPDDEMRLVYEAFPTPSQIIAEELIFLDTTPETLIINNTNLYTNPATGDGILQANYQPPFALDINTFKNYTFFANTKTKFQIPILQLLGVSNISSGDQITISNGLVEQTYTFVEGAVEITDITFDMTGLAASDYMTLYTIGDGNIYNLYYVIDGVGTGPSITGQIDIPVNILSTFTDNDLAIRSMDVINTLVFDYTAEENTLPTIRVTNINEGKCTNFDPGTTPFVMSVFQNGNGEDAATQQVLLSSLLSAAQAIDETARSFVRIINKQATSPVNAYYLSGDNTPPGQINLQNKNISDPAFYIIASSAGLGLSFNPDISPEHTNITAISVANPAVVTTGTPHGLKNNDKIIITGTDSTPTINGVRTVTVLSSTTFSVPVNVTVAGTQGEWTKTSNIEYATNEVRKNRLYYSKVNQPDAVPLLNFLDIGAQDKAILRIFPLRDSLFIFKEDGLYRVSGEIAPFVNSLFDLSCVLVAADSVDVCNNNVYCWTLKGIVRVNETGADNNISRPIDTEILRLGSSVFPNFGTITWGFGYDSDDTYTVYTNTSPDDTAATLGFTYNNITNTWTNVSRTQTCGLVLRPDDKLFMGAGDANDIVKERKNFDRTDYADAEFEIELGGNSIFNNNLTLKFASVNNIEMGDVILQNQDLTIYLFNKLLKELDTDPTVTDDNYFASLQAIPGDDLRSKIVALAVKIDLDPNLLGGYFDRIDAKSGTIVSNDVGAFTLVTTSGAHELVDGRIITITGTQTPTSVPALSGDYTAENTGTFGVSTTFEIDIFVNTAGGTGLSYTTAPNQGSFADIKACFNDIIDRLNSDPGATYSSYKEVTTTTPFEAVVLNVDNKNKKLTLNIPLQWVVGPITVFKDIQKTIIYAPETMGDAVSSKQIYDATVMLESRAITFFDTSFSSDLVPEFFPIEFTGSGNGIFGIYSPPGFGYGFFGGIGNAAPFRTIIPRPTQRCRYILVKVDHAVAREKFVLNGITLTGEVSKSTRAYR